MAAVTGEALRDRSLEWLEADGLGGFASGTVGLVRTRRYHGLLNVAARPPTARAMLVGGLDVRVVLDGEERALSADVFGDGTVWPDGLERLVAFEREPCPRWTWALEGGARVELELVVPRHAALVVLTWRLDGPAGDARLLVRPKLDFRDMHHLPSAEDGPRVREEVGDGRVRWSAGDELPAAVALFDGAFRADAHGYENLLFEVERARGYDHVGREHVPGELALPFDDGLACLVLAADAPALPPVPAVGAGGAAALARELAEAELARRAALGDPLERAAEAYLVRRGAGETVVAGYPWFTDWGRDTLIALRGLCLATGRLDAAEAILVEWSRHVEGGLLPNRFPDEGERAEYNSVDAALWFPVALRAWLEARERAGRPVPDATRRPLLDAVAAIVSGCAAGTRFGIRADADGLLAAGEPGVQLTWMDAKVGGVVVTPRVGKPVEIQALWIHALELAGVREPRWQALAARAAGSFAARFWNRARGCLYDVVDVDHVPGEVDGSVRCNQVLAVGGLPLTPLLARLVPPRQARAVVERVERELWTPLGLRTLAPREPDYVGRYAGDLWTRDHAYHQGTAWPWLLGPFVEAWVRVRGETAAAKRLARERFVAPLREHLGRAGLGHVSEVADGDAPHTPGGCPFQAWSLAELLRLEREVLA